MSSLRINTPADLRALLREDFEFSAQQWAAISAPLEPAVVIAGAGSGKTTLMAARVVYLVANGLVRPDEVLGLTFTTKATAELSARVRTALVTAGLDVSVADEDGGEERAEPTVSTYNAYAATLLAEHGLRIGHEPDTRVMADASRYQLAGRAVDRHVGEVRTLTESPKHVIDYLLALESAMSEHLVSVADVRAFQARERPRFEASVQASRAKADLTKVLTKMQEREELLDLVQGYRTLKQRYGLMDFSDQIALTCELAEGHPGVGVAERAKFRIVLLDEYQDTSVAQARLLSALFSGPDVATGRGHPVTAVGDPNQAIYGWRGASVSNILRFADSFPAADGAVPSYPLTVNRRSGSVILEVANELAGPLYSAGAQVARLEAPAGAAPGRVDTIVHETYADELPWLAGQVLDTHDAGTPWREIGVLTRDNAHAADVFDALTAREVPVEIVGLSGLLRLPEVSEVVATLSLLQDLTANADLLNLLTGPRWAVGTRDLALLGSRARAIAGARSGPAERLQLAHELHRAVSGADPTEVLSLCDALDDPGELAYSPQARERFGLLASELRMLRGHVGEPLLDLVRRIIDTCGIDVELAASVSPAATARRDNLDLFVKAVADFQAIDGQVTLTALLAYLKAEDELGTGLDVATPSEADSVKLLTVHRAKGLEWDAVFLVGVGHRKFPNDRARSQWTSLASVLPAPLRGDARDVPQLRGHEKSDLDDLKQQARDHQALEELRLGYVAFTRPRHQLWVSSYVWKESLKNPVGPSAYQATARDVMATHEVQPVHWQDAPVGETNPLLMEGRTVTWPVTDHTEETLRRVAAAAAVRQEQAVPTRDQELSPEEREIVARWDEELGRLLREARADQADRIDVPLPSSLSATAMTRLRDDPEAFARDLARPMPRQPSPAARFGTRFHAWVEARFGQQQLLEPDELSGRGDVGIDDEADLQELIATFEGGPFADRIPHAVEPPFALVLAGQVVRGRIDAVYVDKSADGFLIVDWKTSRHQSADPLQLAIYRLAWSELTGVPLDRVSAAFHYVRTGETVEPDELPGRAELEDLLTRPARQ